MDMDDDDTVIVRCFALVAAATCSPGLTEKAVLRKARAFEHYLTGEEE